MTIEKKPWYSSKTKWAAILGAVGLLAPALSGWLSGGVFPINTMWQAIVIVLGVFGVRDLPFINKK